MELRFICQVVNVLTNAKTGWPLAPVACPGRATRTSPAAIQARQSPGGHAMALPRPDFRSNAGLKALREHVGPILFAHADLSGFSVFEEASWWGYRAAQLASQDG